MENRVKLSDFKMVCKYRIIDKIFTKVEEKISDKDIEFYTFSKEEINNLEKFKDEKEDLVFLYELIKTTTNVEMDMTIEEFKTMCNKTASLLFKSFIEKVLAWYYQIIDESIKGAEIENGIQETLNKFNNIIPQEPIKTKEEQLKEINAELETTRYKELLALKTQLEADING